MLFRNEEAGFVQPSSWTPDGKQILTLFFRKDNISQLRWWMRRTARSFAGDNRGPAICALSIDGSRETELPWRVCECTKLDGPRARIEPY